MQHQRPALPPLATRALDSLTPEHPAMVVAGRWRANVGRGFAFTGRIGNCQQRRTGRHSARRICAVMSPGVPSCPACPSAFRAITMPRTHVEAGRVYWCCPGSGCSGRSSDARTYVQCPTCRQPMLPRRGQRSGYIEKWLWYCPGCDGGPTSRRRDRKGPRRGPAGPAPMPIPWAAGEFNLGRQDASRPGRRRGSARGRPKPKM